MNEKDLLVKMAAVKRIARRFGYPEYKAEDISHQVALRAVEGRKLDKQSHYQSYVDALREGSERTHSRSGAFAVPIYENQFEGLSDILNNIRSEIDPGNVEENDRNVYDIVFAIASLKEPMQRAIILVYFYGWTLDRISKYEGVTESRISQRHCDALKSLKETVTQTRLSSEKQAERKLKKYRALPYDLQDKPRVDEKESREFSSMGKKEQGVLSFKIKEISKTLCSSF
jgi:RNA polymerase sigma factor (sigma-70 family)